MQEDETQIETESNTLLNENPSPNPLLTKSEKKDKVSTKSRTALWHLTFWGFVINYLVRCNLNMAIVSMVVQKKVSSNSSTESLECFNSSSKFLLGSSIDQYQSEDNNRTYFSLERSGLDLFMVSKYTYSH